VPGACTLESLERARHSGASFLVLILSEQLYVEHFRGRLWCSTVQYCMLQCSMSWYSSLWYGAVWCIHGMAYCETV